MVDVLGRPVVPIANEGDATTTYEGLRPYLEPDVTPLFVNVIEKAGGGIDKASVEQREEVAKTAFDAVRTLAADDGREVETRILYATNVAEAVNDLAREEDATAIVFASRGGGRLLDMLSGSVRTSLVQDSDVPVVVLPTH